MQEDFTDQVALVTGAGSGIGKAISLLLAERGAQVVVADRDADAAEKVASEIGADVMRYTVDVAVASECADMVQAVVDRFGRLDLAVNNAGVNGPARPAGEYPVDEWDRIISINLNGTFYCMRAEIPAMLASGGGAIVNMASILGSVGFPNASAYVAAKHGVVGLTKTAAAEYAKRGIRINSVGPGFVDTPLLSPSDHDALAALHPLGRLGRSDEIAELTSFLLSERSSNTTGSYFVSDGGFTAR